MDSDRGKRETGDGRRETPEPKGVGRRRATGSSGTRLPVESRVPVIVLIGGLPGVIISLVWLWTGDHGIEVRWTLTVVVSVRVD